MKYYCVKKSKVLTEIQYRTCLDCANTPINVNGKGCLTLDMVGGQNSKEFMINMKTLVKVKEREKKLNRIAYGTDI